MKRFLPAFVVIGAVVVVHVVVVALGVYQAILWFDVPMHFFGGYAMAMLGLAFFRLIQSRTEFPKGSGADARWALIALEGVFVVGFAMLIGIAWEWYEFLFDQFATSMVAQYGFAQMGIADTMGDFFNDAVGAVIAWVMWRERA